MRTSTSQRQSLPATASSRLRMAAAAAIFAAAGLASPAIAQNWHWNVANGAWSTGTNWLPAVPPAPGANVFIGSSAPALNGTVTLNSGVQAAQLTITDGMTVRNEHWSMWVAGTTSISGSNTAAGPFGQQVVYPSRLVLDTVDGNSLTTDDLTISDEGRLDCLNQAFVAVKGAASTATQGRIGGIGNISLNGAGTTLNNNGRIVPGGNGSVGLHFVNANGGLFDLDGTGGDGVLDLSTTGTARLRFTGPGLADDFGGMILLTSGAQLDMNLGSPWTVDFGAEIDMTTTALAQQAIIRGSAMTLVGDVDIHGSGGWLLFNPASLTINSPATVTIAANNFFETGQFTPVEISGGTFNIGHSGNLSGGVAIHGPATVRGGQFNTSVPDNALSQVSFFGATTWNGTVNMACNAAQYGDATVSGATVINARRMVMCPGAGTTWAVNAGLVINTQGLSWMTNNTEADINIAGGLLPKLTVNLDDPQAHWSAFGDINIVGSGSIFLTRIAGSPVHTFGNVTLTTGRAQITADTEFHLGTVNIGPASAELRLMADSLVGDAVVFTGQGVLRNGPDGHMRLESGAELAQVGLRNEGVLDLGAGPVGTVSVDRLACDAGSTLAIDIGGPLAGTQHDLLLVAGGGAALAGEIEVRIPVLGGPAFVPAIGDEFTVLTALGDVTGTFTNTPQTQFGGSIYHWEVIYGQHTVVLRMIGITPAPCNDADVAGLGGSIGPDGQLTADDVIAYLNAFFANNIAVADIALLGGAPGHDGALTPDDLIYFLAEFFRPCEH